VRTAAALAGIVPGTPVVLVANVVTSRLGDAAEAAGLAGVVSTPVTAGKLEAVLAGGAAAGRAQQVEAPEAVEVPEEPAGAPAEPAEERVLVFEVFPAAGAGDLAADKPESAVGVEPAGGAQPVPPDAAVPEEATATPAETPEPAAVEPARPEVAVPSAREGRVVAVMSGKGGSGKTITAVNLAAALALEDAGGVAVVDADFQFGDVAMMLAVTPAGTLDEAAGAADAAEIGRMVSLHERGIAVLAAPARPLAPGEVDADGIVRVIETLAAAPGIVIVDTPPVFGEALLAVLAASDLVLLVVDMDLPSVRSAITALGVLRASGFPLERVRAVVNRADSKARLDQAELTRSLGVPVLGTIPSDRLVPQSVNEGEPAVFLAERSRVARSFRAMAAGLRRELSG
jgi:MinD-like ATPase involved in chromosome partitioning or flagellar assembly